jgi:hypothetical protein
MSFIEKPCPHGFPIWIIQAHIQVLCVLNQAGKTGERIDNLKITGKVFNVK